MVHRPREAAHSPPGPGRSPHAGAGRRIVGSPMVLPLRQAQTFQERRSSAQPFLGPVVGVADGHEDVLERGHPRQEVEALEDETDVPVAERRQLGVVHARHRLVQKPVFARVGSIQAAEYVHQRGLSGTGWSHHRDVVADFDFEIDLVQRVNHGLAHLERVTELGCGDNGFGHDAATVGIPPSWTRRSVSPCNGTSSEPSRGFEGREAGVTAARGRDAEHPRVPMGDSDDCGHAFPIAWCSGTGAFPPGSCV